MEKEKIKKRDFSLLLKDPKVKKMFDEDAAEVKNGPADGVGPTLGTAKSIKASFLVHHATGERQVKIEPTELTEFIGLPAEPVEPKVKIISKVVSNPEKKFVLVWFGNDKKPIKVQCDNEDTFDPYVGVALALSKQFFKSTTQFRKAVDDVLIEQKPKIDYASSSKAPDAAKALVRHIGYAKATVVIQAVDWPDYQAYCAKYREVPPIRCQEKFNLIREYYYVDKDNLVKEKNSSKCIKGEK